MSYRHVSAIAFLLIVFQPCWGQKHNLDSLRNLGVCSENGFTIPSILGVPRSKGIEVYQERTPNYTLSSTYVSNDSSYQNSIRRSKIWAFRLRAPLVNKEHFKLIMGLKYTEQEFAFDLPKQMPNSFHQTLQDKRIKSFGTSLIGLWSFIGNKYLIVRGTYRLNGDFDQNRLLSHQKATIAALYGIKRHHYNTMGFGLSYSNTFGRSSIYPVVFYRNRFRPKWVFDALLPVSVSMLYRPNEKNNFYWRTQLEGDNYNISLPSVSQNPLYLENADLKSFLSYEREIHDFLWFSVSGGLRWNINFDVSDSDAFFGRNFPIGTTKHIAINSDLQNALFFRVGFFVVPPKKWLK